MQVICPDLTRKKLQLVLVGQTRGAGRLDFRGHMVWGAQQALPAGPVDQLSVARIALDDLLSERRAVLVTAANQVAERSSELLKARLKRDGSPKEYVEAFCGLLDGARVTDAEAKCSGRIEASLATAQDSAWFDIGDKLIDIYQTKISSGNPPEPMEALATKIREFLAFDGIATVRQIAKIYENIDDTKVASLLSATPSDHIVLTYVDEGRDIAFSKASEGQQASALLELLLRQSAGTLLIDQPEDDLDNRVIMRIVNLIRNSKSRRQLIFATHNPNLVVNGDADKVVALKAGEQAVGSAAEVARILLAEDGAIETSAVRDIITHIMEGGKDAFDLRSRKYGFDNFS